VFLKIFKALIKAEEILMLLLTLMKSETGIDFNRSTKISFKGDTSKPFSIGIQDLDEAVFYYFNNVIKPFVYQNGERRKFL
jgi:hypothetical protein